MDEIDCHRQPRGRGSTGARIEARLSSAPRWLPGRLTIRVEPLRPATPRESQAKGLRSAPRARMASARPGASRSMTRRVASGVRSRGPMPVPPAVRIRAAPSRPSSPGERQYCSLRRERVAVSTFARGPVLAQQRDNGWACSVGGEALGAAVGDGENGETAWR